RRRPRQRRPRLRPRGAAGRGRSDDRAPGETSSMKLDQYQRNELEIAAARLEAIAVLARQNMVSDGRIDLSVDGEVASGSTSLSQDAVILLARLARGAVEEKEP